MHYDDHLVNFELLNGASAAIHGGATKRAFVPSGDMQGMGDPSRGQMPPGDPSAMGGAPPQSSPEMQQILTRLAALESAGGGGAGGAAGAAGAAGAVKPKIDQNVVMLQILKLLARLCDAQGIQVPASEMVPGQADLNQLVQATQAGQPLPGMDPTAQGGAGAGAIPPMQPMQGAGIPGQGVEKGGSYREQGTAFDPVGMQEIGVDFSTGLAREMGNVQSRAEAVAFMMRGTAG